MKLIIDIFITFLKIGAFSFGGGYAMLPLIEREIVSNHGWITLTQFKDIIGISQMTPGPIAINSATFVGFTTAGILGSLAGTIGVITISFILISIANHFLVKFKESNIMKAALMGMRPALIGLILSVFITLAKDAYMDIKSIIIGLIIGGLLFTNKFHPILVIVFSAVLGLIFYGVVPSFHI